jgi:HEAT repeat protein
MFLESKNPVLVRALVARYSGKIGIAGLMNLLSHPDEAVRITAVTSLKDVNEIAILKLILEKYEEEKSPAVRQAYRDNFWMIKGRDDN